MREAAMNSRWHGRLALGLLLAPALLWLGALVADRLLRHLYWHGYRDR